MKSSWFLLVFFAFKGRENSWGIPLVQQVVRCAQDPSYYLCPRIHYLLDIYVQRAQKPLSDQWRHGRFIHEKEPWQSDYSYNRKKDAHINTLCARGLSSAVMSTKSLLYKSVWWSFSGEGGPIRQALSAFAKITSSTVFKKLTGDKARQWSDQPSL